MKYKLFIYYFGLLLSWPVIGQEDSDIILVTPTRSSNTTTTLPAQVITITHEEIQQSGAINIAEVLKNVANIQVRDDFSDGSRTVISLRGFGENASQNTLILVDGRRLNNTLDISPPDLTSISLDEIEQIEIINGSAGVLYGENAVGGVINIITKKIHKNGLIAEATSGSYNLEKYYANASYQFNSGFGIQVIGQKKQTDNYRRHNHNETNYYKVKLEYQHRYGHIFFEALEENENLETPGSLFAEQKGLNRRAASNYFDYIDTDNHAYRLGLYHDLSYRWHTEVDFTWRDTDSMGFLTVGGFGSDFAQNRQQWSINPRLIGTYETDDMLHIITIGIDYDDSKYNLSSVLGIQSAQQQSASLYGQIIYSLLPDLQLNMGIRYTDVETKLKDNFTFPDGETARDNLTATSLGLNYHVNDYLNIYVRRDENYRFAKVDEHTNQLFGVQQPLVTQTGISYELGSQFNYKKFTVNANIYKLSIENEIAYDPAVFGNRNLDNTDRYGFNISSQYQINHAASVNLQYAYTKAEFDNGINKGNKIPFVAEHLVTGSVSYQFNDNFNGYLEYQYIDEKFASGDDANALTPIHGYHVVNAHLSYRYKQFTFSSRINNIFNEKYDSFGTQSFNPFPQVETAFFPASERNFVLSFKFEI